MIVVSLLAPNIYNYYNLALFICHLFIDGQFRTGHILYDPIQLDDRLIAEVDRICPHSIPWVTTEVNRDFSLPWNSNNQTDHILQLIFIDPNHLPENIDDLKYLFAYYNLYIIQSTNEINPKNPSATILKLSAHIDYRSPHQYWILFQQMIPSAYTGSWVVLTSKRRRLNWPITNQIQIMEIVLI